MLYKHKFSENEVTKHVSIGFIETGKHGEVLCPTLLGSCVAVVAYDKKTNIGGMAHIMLPGKSPQKNHRDENKYALNRIDNLLCQLYKKGAQKSSIIICLIGGANVLKKKNNCIAADVVSSVIKK